VTAPLKEKGQKEWMDPCVYNKMIDV
jgi:hypothetical protein